MNKNLILFVVSITLFNLLLTLLVGQNTLNLYIFIGTKLIEWTDFKVNIFYLDYAGFLAISFLLMNIGFLLLYSKIKNLLVNEGSNSF